MAALLPPGEGGRSPDEGSYAVTFQLLSAGPSPLTPLPIARREKGVLTDALWGEGRNAQC